MFRPPSPYLSDIGSVCQRTDKSPLIKSAEGINQGLRPGIHMLFN